MDLASPPNISISETTALRNSSSGFIRFPPTVLDAFVPGYSFLAEFFLEFGIDISFYVSLFALTLVCSTALRLTITPLWIWVLNSVSSVVVIDEYDPIYSHVLGWIGAQKSLQNLRSIRGHSQGQWYDDSDDEDELEIQEGIPEDTIFNFNDWAARAPPKYEPDSSSGLFWHKGCYFRIVRHKEKVGNEWSGAVRDREQLILMAYWRSTLPIKELIEEARELHLAKQHSMTVIRRPASKEERGRRHGWHKVASRPSRSMTTVVLDDVQKAAILQDINDFLHPKTARWYSNRGIPYRRGYLFHGPPGTGKTSLSFALAGVFGLDIYCLSLSEVTLTEEALIMLFNTLPKRCIVLLEDIDSAGVSRPKPQKKSKKKKKKKKNKKKVSAKNAEKPKAAATASKTVESLAQKAVGEALKSASNVGGAENLVNAISISGLLNAIDGVSSQEGRVLIMTTNFVEKLDDALVRPGRVDLKIEFALANKQQLRELFLRMYCADSNDAVRQPTKISHVLPTLASKTPSSKRDTKRTFKGEKTKQHTVLKDIHRDRLTPPATRDAQTNVKDNTTMLKGAQKSSSVTVSDEKPIIGQFDIESFAEQFALELPEFTFSPAEIQGYLMMRKKNPVQAVVDVAAWRDEELAKKNIKVAKKEQPSQNELAGLRDTLGGEGANQEEETREGEVKSTIEAAGGVVADDHAQSEDDDDEAKEEEDDDEDSDSDDDSTSDSDVAGSSSCDDSSMSDSD